MPQKNAAFLIIGNEILSGRTTDKNLASLTHLLKEKGIPLKEVRIVRDTESAIVHAVNALREKFDYVFTSGGIGPTHDDITSACIAKAFQQPLIEHEQAVKILQHFYLERQLEFTPERRRMSRAPQKATIITSDFPGAPAFYIENVFVLAGVPAIFSLMAKAACQLLPQQTITHSQSIKVLCGESQFSEMLRTTATKFSSVEIGSYPRDENGVYSCHVVFSSTDTKALDTAKNYFTQTLTQQKLPYE